MKDYFFIRVLFLMMIINGCNISSEKKIAIRGFDISLDDKSILFSLVENNNTSLQEKSINDGLIKTIIKSNKNKFYANPRYSLDLQKVVFIEYDKSDMQNSSLCVVKIDGTNKQYLIKNQGIVSEAIFSRYGNEILFTKANEYTKSSPIGVNAAHDFDIYSINLASNEVTKLSNMNAYSIHQLFEVDSNHLLFYTFDPEKGGMMLFNRDYPEEIKRIVPVNNPRGDAAMYDSPIYSEKFNMLAFIAPYELFLMDKENKIAKSLFKSKASHIDYISFFHNEEKIMFVINGDPNFYTINLDGNGLKKIFVK
ncbi:MAG: hypothetical protein J5I47_05695 [Vicingus serpentipes]|nr:hypothetical protein [Vicingus serpentipes]